MGFIHGCNICNTPRDIGEIETNDLNKLILTKLSTNIIHLRQETTMSNVENYEINKILTSINITTPDDIEFPNDIITQIRDKNASLKQENIKYSNGDTYDGTINKNNKKEGFGTYTTNNGYIIKSLWKDDQISDYGIFIDPEGNYIKGTIINGDIKEGYVRKIDLKEIAKLIVRGGWPENIDMPDADIGVIPESYIEAIIKKDMHEMQDKKRNPEKMRMLIRSLARNESTIVGNKTLIRDIEEYDTGDELIESRITIADYLSVLDSLYLTANQEAYSLNYRSSSRVGKSAKRHLVDPSLCCAALGLTVDKLMYDHETFGLLFESLAERDLRIYAEYLGGHLYHFRDNVSGDEVDALIEFKDGSYAAFEIKLSDGSIQEAVSSLTKFYERVKKKPVFMCVIVGHLDAVMRDPDTGIFIVPITSLKP